VFHFLVKTSEDNYILGSKKNIDNFIFKNKYRKAFELLIIVLERLDDKEKVEVIGLL
jgi:hypothetical protein